MGRGKSESREIRGARLSPSSLPLALKSKETRGYGHKRRETEAETGRDFVAHPFSLPGSSLGRAPCFRAPHLQLPAEGPQPRAPRPATHRGRGPAVRAAPRTAAPWTAGRGAASGRGTWCRGDTRAAAPTPAGCPRARGPPASAGSGYWPAPPWRPGRRHPQTSERWLPRRSPLTTACSGLSFPARRPTHRTLGLSLSTPYPQAPALTLGPPR